MIDRRAGPGADPWKGFSCREEAERQLGNATHPLQEATKKHGSTQDSGSGDKPSLGETGHPSQATGGCGLQMYTTRVVRGPPAEKLMLTPGAQKQE